MAVLISCLLNPYNKSYRAHRKEHLARSKMEWGITQGRLPQRHTQLCVFCGEMSKEYHHFNYDFPLVVIPICVKDHNILHVFLKKKK